MYRIIYVFTLWIVYCHSEETQVQCMDSVALKQVSEFDGLIETKVNNLNLNFEPFVSLVQELYQNLNILKTSVPSFLSDLKSQVPNTVSFLYSDQLFDYYISKQEVLLSKVDVECISGHMISYKANRKNIIETLKNAKDNSVDKIATYVTSKHNKIYSDGKVLTTFDPSNFNDQDFKIPVIFQLKPNNDEDFIFSKGSLADKSHYICMKIAKNFAAQTSMNLFAEEILKNFKNDIADLIVELDSLSKLANVSYNINSNFVNVGQSIKVFCPYDVIMNSQKIFRLSKANSLSQYPNDLFSLDTIIEELKSYFLNCKRNNLYIFRTLDNSLLKKFAKIPNDKYVSPEIKVIPNAVTNDKTDYILNAKLLIKTSHNARKFLVYKIIPLGWDGKIITEKFLIKSNQSINFVYASNPIYNLNCYQNNTVCQNDVINNPSQASINCANGILTTDKTLLQFCNSNVISTPLINQIHCNPSSNKNLVIYAPEKNSSYPFTAVCTQNVIKFLLKSGRSFLKNNCDIRDGFTNKLLFKKNNSETEFPPQIPEFQEQIVDDTYFLITITLACILTVSFSISISIFIYCQCCNSSSINCCSCKKHEKAASENFPLQNHNFRVVKTNTNTPSSNFSTLRQSNGFQNENQNLLFGSAPEDENGLNQS